MEKTPDKKFTSIQLSVDLRQRIDQRLLERKYGGSPVTFEGAVHEALELWLAEAAGEIGFKVETPLFQKPNKKWHMLLEEVLNHGGPDAIEAVRSNLIVFERYVRARPPSKKGKVG